MNHSVIPHSAFRTPHSLLPLFPQFLQRRRRGFPGIPAILADTGLSRLALFLLIRVGERPPEGSTTSELRPGAPYATRDPHLPWLDEATAASFLARDDAGRYSLTERGRAMVERMEREGTAYLAALRPLLDKELARLADEFGSIADGLDERASGPEAHLLHGRRIAALVPGASAAPLVRLERAIFDLWMARDDAHMAAWRAAHFHGPQLAVLTHLWHGDADDLATLQTLLAPTQDADDVAAHVEEFIEQGYVEWRHGALQPTRAGYNVREAIESNTDDLYFRQWPPLDLAALTWLHDTLRRLIDALPEAP
jgi:hypothetical protein